MQRDRLTLKAEEQEGRRLNYQGQKYIMEQVVVWKLPFRTVLPKLCELGTRAEQLGFFHMLWAQSLRPVSFPRSCENV